MAAATVQVSRGNSMTGSTSLVPGRGRGRNPTLIHGWFKAEKVVPKSKRTLWSGWIVLEGTTRPAEVLIRPVSWCPEA